MKNIVITLILLIGAIAGCSPYRIVRNQQDKSATWLTYRTFAFVDTSRLDPVPSIAYQAAVRQVRQAIDAELMTNGYRQISDAQANPDLLVNIGVVVNEKTQTRQTTINEAPRYMGQRRYNWQSQEVPVGTYKEGTLNVHIIDSKQNALVWDAAVSGVFRKKGITPEQINEAVREVFSKFPGKRS